MQFSLDVYPLGCESVEIMSGEVRDNDYEAFVAEIAPIFEKYSECAFKMRRTTRSTVCKTNIRNALRTSYNQCEYGFIPKDEDYYISVNDRWKAAWTSYYRVELYDWRSDVSLEVKIHPHKTFTEELEEATQLLMDAYEEHCNND